MSLVSKAFSDIVTFSRSSNATRIGPTGRVEYAPHNLILQSQTLDNASWSKTAASITANALAAPDGSVTADKLVEDNTNAAHYVGSNAPSVTDGVAYTISVYAKAGERSVLQIVPSAAGFPVAFANFDLSTGVMGSLSGVTSHSITSVGNGWYRCSVTVSANATTTSGFVLVVQNSTTAARVGSYTGDGTSGIYLWGAQLSVGPYPLDYTPTTSAAVYGPRFDYDPVTLAARGLLIEEQRTNLVTYSEKLSNTDWSATAVSVTENSIISPDGTQTAGKMTVNTTSNSSHQRYQIGKTITSGAAYTASVYMKAGEYNWGIVNIFDTTDTNRRVYFNLSTGTIGTVEFGCTASIQSVGNGWYRCIVTKTSASTSGGMSVEFSNADNVSIFAGALNSGIYAWGAQYEAGSFATSYIPTVAASVTRSADVASVNTLSPWWNATESTIYSEFDTFSTNDAFPYALGVINTDEIDVYRIGSSGNVLTLMFASSSLQNNSTIATATSLNATIKAAYAVKANDLAGSANGGAAVTDTSATLPSVSTLYLGARSNGTGPLNGHLRRLAVYPRRLTNAELVALSA